MNINEILDKNFYTECPFYGDCLLATISCLDACGVREEIKKRAEEFEKNWKSIFDENYDEKENEKNI